MRIPDPRYVTRRVRRQFQLASRPKHAPSFWARLQKRRELWRYLVSVHGTEHEIFPEYSKLHARDLAEAAGVGTPELLDGLIASNDLDPERYGDDFVVKPNWGTSSRGVLVVSKTGPDSYLDLVDGDEMNARGLRLKAGQRVSVSGRGNPDDLIVERSMAVGSNRPQEWKIWVFGDAVGLIQQVDRSSGVIRGRNFRADWSPTGRIRPDRLESLELPPPHNGQAVLAAAIKIAAQIPSGFVRVDLYESPATKEPVLGEVCLIPGGDLYLWKGFDRELGAMWDRADAKLIAARQPLVP